MTIEDARLELVVATSDKWMSWPDENVGMFMKNLDVIAKFIVDGSDVVLDEGR